MSPLLCELCTGASLPLHREAGYFHQATFAGNTQVMSLSVQPMPVNSGVDVACLSHVSCAHMVSQAAPAVHERCFDVLVAKHPHTKRAEELRLEALQDSDPEDSIWDKISRLQKKAVGKHFPHL